MKLSRSVKYLLSIYFLYIASSILIDNTVF